MSWTPSINGQAGPLYRQIADTLAADVAGGRLHPGDRLPTQRDLARQLGIDLTTVTRAYAEAASRGLIASEGRRGSFVLGRSGEPDGGNEAATGMNMPPEPESDLLRRKMLEAMRGLLESRSAPLHYQASGGTERQRAAAATFIAPMIPGASPDQMVMTAGSQNALQSILSSVIRPGDRIAVGEYAYPGFLAAARRAGAQLVPIAMDRDGVQLEALERAAAEGLRAVYLVPTNDNPTTATMPLVRRREVADLARRHGFLIIEDDAYGRLPAEALPPIASFAPECSWHITTVSKLISPSLRVGFVRAPSVSDAHDLAAAIHDSLIMPPPLNASLVAQWIETGEFARLLDAVRAEAGARMEIALGVLGPLGATGHPEGYHLWLPLPKGLPGPEIAAQVIAAGLPAVSSRHFAVEPRAEAAGALRISLGGSMTRARMTRELHRLDAIIRQASQGRNSFV